MLKATDQRDVSTTIPRQQSETDSGPRWAYFPYIAPLYKETYITIYIISKFLSVAPPATKLIREYSLSCFLCISGKQTLQHNVLPVNIDSLTMQVLVRRNVSQGKSVVVPWQFHYVARDEFRAWNTQCVHIDTRGRYTVWETVLRFEVYTI